MTILVFLHGKVRGVFLDAKQKDELISLLLMNCLVVEHGSLGKKGKNNKHN